MNRDHVQSLIVERRRDAESLRRQHRWGFTYYAIGYTVELGLKSCILVRMIHNGWVFAERLPVKSFMTHDFNELVQLARLEQLLDTERAANKQFAKHWGLALRWKETVRYAWPEPTRDDAEGLFEAITDNTDGVLP